MSVSQIRHTFVTTLDFGQSKLSKSYVAKELRDTPFCYSQLDEHTGNLTCVEHEVKVGAFKIHVVLPPRRDANCLKYLCHYKKFNIRIYGETKFGKKEIELNKDKIFKNQYWAGKNNTAYLEIKDLIEAIVYCSRITDLKHFYEKII